MAETYDLDARRPREQWWMDLTDVMQVLSTRPTGPVVALDGADR
jgi:hypothetical protein